MKVLFLDIYGAIDNASSFFGQANPEVRYPIDAIFYDRKALAFVQNLTNFDVKVVLIGERRKGHTLKQLQAKYDFNIFDKAEHVSFSIKTDEDHVHDWLAKHPEVERHVVLNTERHYERLTHFTVCPFDGLKYKQMLHIVHALGIKDYK